MKKKDNNIFTVLLIIGIILLIYGGNSGWFKSTYTIKSLETNLTPSPNQPVLNSCSELCTQQGFSKSYSSSECKAGESKVTYGYPNQAPLLVCCCYNEIISTHTCTDTDGGDNKDVPGTVTYDGTDKYMDYCFDATTVYEYRCFEDNTWGGRKISCDSGQTCLSSRSGGYCHLRTWNPGDTVWTGSGSASVIGTASQISSIDLSDYGISIDGNCRLGVQLSTSWYYANDKCVGIPGMQGVKWDLYDSNGLEYTRTDIAPISLGVDLHPESHIWNWDGHTKWIASMTPYPFPFNDCSITYEYSARIYIYDCI